MPDNATEVTAAGIARLAGVGRAAVSNWRRRHADFPKPVGGTETSPSFALAEIEDWLRTQGKLAEVPLRERVWQQVAGHPAGAVTALVHTGCVLLLVRERPTAWRATAAGSDDTCAELLPTALAQVLDGRLGGEWLRAVRTPDATALAASVPLLRAAAELAAQEGPSPAYEFLLGRHLDANPRQYTLTPPGPAALMAALAGHPRTVLDPACGTASLLCAVAEAGGESDRPSALYAQDADPDLAALAALRLALRADARTTEVRAAAADTLRADAYPQISVDAVVSHPPFNERNWGHDELAYDPRWEYGFPARTESELAWVQHALARLRPGGTAVLLMPPAAASRRSGRRIRADLLRRGALRAVVALPAGAAPPYGIPLHLWILRKPETSTSAGASASTTAGARTATGGGRNATGPGARTAPELLLVDTADLSEAGRDRLDWAALHTAVLTTWQTFDRDGTVEERPGVSRAVPVIELLDDDVDLAPARHLPPSAAGGGVAELASVRERLADTLRLTAELNPHTGTGASAPPAHWPLTTVGELARAGALVLRTGSAAGGGPAGARVLTEQDVLTGGTASGAPGDTGDGDAVLTAPGDVVVPVLGGGSIARVVDEAGAGAVLGRNLHLLRPDPAAVDPWFLAGFLRGTANNRQASSFASTAARLDVRRLQLPRLPLADQRRYGDRFRALAAFEDALRLAGRLGEQLVQGLYDGLADGTVPPE
ncbi:type II restriction endonuclease subunit M [Streptomyces spiroverticillatus]|uniref:Type II restriction endonuclease subunit M n=1 Tax=Streptomyces finlayi TaxID=67296 RepID=A0A918X852_9ACTN|nr:N-6 DNA methylase [Streptomyces finlayi]GHA41639.1 type II restriction endonuclease subunit M [Streptomyces spiroverticillatus]GHD16498.1 type II restriction endonuclease subunit M [Streptomyces finlayi]